MLFKFISWNVNGLRSLLKKPEWDWLARQDAQIWALQETKATPGQLPPEIVDFPGRETFWASSEVKKGYSGVAVFTSVKPLGVEIELPDVRYRGEGRLLRLEYPRFYFFNGYFPNGGAPETDENGSPTGKFRRVPYKLGFYEEFFRLCIELEKSRPIIICGDFNIAHRPIDLYNPKANEKASGFLPEEREYLDKFVQAGFVDAFRHVHGQVADKYTWWSYQRSARKKNQGWRIDYFLVSKALVPAIRDARIYSEIGGSDHCPVGLEIELAAD